LDHQVADVGCRCCSSTAFLLLHLLNWGHHHHLLLLIGVAAVTVGANVLQDAVGHVHALVVHQHNVVLVQEAVQQGVNVEVELKKVGESGVKNSSNINKNKWNKQSTHIANLEHHSLLLDADVHVNV
jgi:hypothetical protein